MSTKSNDDRAGVAHWDENYDLVERSNEAFDPIPGVRGYARRCWDKKLRDALAKVSGPRAQLLELGCGGSALLPYFANQLDFSVSGIDYSESGIESARRLCAVHKVDAELIFGDFFNPPAQYLGKFDAVVSFGVVEHFTDTDKTVRLFGDFLKPGGILITTVPNMLGLSGLGQKLLSRSIYNIHETITPERLRTAHEKANLKVESCDYFLFNNFGVINPGVAPSSLARLGFLGLRAITGAIWATESMLGRYAPNRVTSPYVVAIAQKRM